MASTCTENLKVVFGGIPKLIEDNIAILKYVEKEYVCDKSACKNVHSHGDYECDLCNTLVCTSLLSADETARSFQHHFVSELHLQNESKKKESTVMFEKKVRKMFSNIEPITKYGGRDIPPIVFVNLPFLYSESDYGKCLLCKGTIFYTEDYSYRGEDEMCRHLLSDEHEGKVKIFNDKCYIVKSHLEKTYGFIPSYVLSNRSYIKIKNPNANGEYYFCDLCDNKFEVGDSKRTLVEQFEIHFRSSDHLSKANQQKALKKIPELGNYFSNRSLPHYIISNIEYIEYFDRSRDHGRDIGYFYCSLCTECIQTNYDKYNHQILYETAQNLKFHLSSLTHKSNLLSLRDVQNEVYSRLHQLFESFSLTVIEDLNWLSLRKNRFFCVQCKCEVTNQNDISSTERSILAHFSPEYKNISLRSSLHRSCLDKSCYSNSIVPQLVEDAFGSGLPKLIQESIKYLLFPDKNGFILCIQCDKKLMVSKKEIGKHLMSKTHTDMLCYVNSESKEVISKFYYLFSQPYIHRPLVNPVPKFIQNRYSTVSYGDTSSDMEYKYDKFIKIYDSDDSYEYIESRKVTRQEEEEKQRVKGFNYVCKICSYYDAPSIIIVGKSERNRSLHKDYYLDGKQTEYNFRTHHLSQDHKFFVEKMAIDQVKAQEKLEELFGSTPRYISNSIHHMVPKYIGPDFNIFECSLCSSLKNSSSILGMSKRDLENHILGYEPQYKAENSVHQKMERETEEENIKAMEELGMKFWKIPEIVLKNIEFLSLSGRNLFCNLCQDTLYIDEYDLEEVEADLCNHMGSIKHTTVFNGISGFIW